MSDDEKEDLRWFNVFILSGRLNSISLARFTRRHEHGFRIHIDASDQGLCTLFPAQKQYLQVKFTHELAVIRHCNGTGESRFALTCEN